MMNLADLRDWIIPVLNCLSEPNVPSFHDSPSTTNNPATLKIMCRNTNKMLWELSYSTSHIRYLRLVRHFIRGDRSHTNSGNVFTEKTGVGAACQESPVWDF